MPELPEVERACRLLLEHCLDKRCDRVVSQEQGGGPRDGQYDDIVFKELHVPAVSAAQATEVVAGEAALTGLETKYPHLERVLLGL